MHAARTSPNALFTLLVHANAFLHEMHVHMWPAEGTNLNGD
jgi:hypothetical protein